MILSAREYAEKYAGGVHRTTLIRRIRKGLLPTNHIAKKVGRDWIIEIGELEHLKKYDIILKPKSKL